MTVRAHCAGPDSEFPPSCVNKMDGPRALALFELLESSSSSSEEEYEFVDVICQIVEHVRGKRRCVRSFHEEVVGTFSRREFMGHFRIGKDLFDQLVDEFKESKHFPRRQPGGNYTPISAKKHILCFLWYVGHPANTFRSITDKFDLTKHSLALVMSRVNSFLFDMSQKVIKWPDDENAEETVQKLQKKFGIPNVIGVIASAQATINEPVVQPELYLNKNNDYSIQLQGIFDHQGKFVNVFIGYPGSVRDATVLENSLVHEKLPELCKDKYLLGDCSYPLQPWLLTPYQDDGSLSPEQQNFNSKISSVTEVTQPAFDALKRRFPVLRRLPLRRENEICRTILSCCVLHNLADIKNLELLNDDNDDQGGYADGPAVRDDPHDESDRIDGESYRAALTLRDKIAEGLLK